MPDPAIAAPAAPVAPTPPASESFDSAFDTAFAKPVNGTEPQKPAATAPETVEAKPVEKKEPEQSEKPKKGIDALAGEEPEKQEEAKPDEKKEPEEPEVDTKNWGKVQRDAFAAARVKNKLVAQERDDARKKAQELEKQIETLKAAPPSNEKELAELKELREWKYAQDVKQSPEWKTAVAEPLDAVLGMLGQIAEFAKVDKEALEKATDEPIPFKRALAIRKVFDAAEEPVDATIVTTALAEADKLHPIYAKATELEKNASEVWRSLQTKTAEQKAQESKAEESKYLESHEHLSGQFATKFPSLFKDPAVAEAVKTARPATDPADKAWQVHAGALLIPLSKQLAEARAEIARLKTSEATLLGTRATVVINGDTVPKEPESGELDGAAFADALKRRG